MLVQVAVSDAPVFARGWKYAPTRPSFSMPHSPCGLHSAMFCEPNGRIGLSYGTLLYTMWYWMLAGLAEVRSCARYVTSMWIVVPFV